MSDFDRLWSYTTPSTFHEASARKLYEVALTCKGVYVEVGVNKGTSATLLLGAAQKTGAKVILVDRWNSVLRDNYETVCKHVAQYFPDVLSEIMFMDSLAAVPIVRDTIGQIDLLHLDADNGWQNTIGPNCKAWFPLLKPGGIVCIFDYVAAPFPQVKEIVDVACEGWEDLGVTGSLAVRRKP
jgi:predicted O-methyltransferase YrrM